MALTSNSKSAATWQASGEATPSAPLPEQYVPSARASNMMHDSLRVPPDWNGNVKREPIVQRAQRTVGMKYLYASGATRMPINRVGADGVPYPFDSSFQPNLHGPIHNAGFNYALYQAGYPGYNLGLSFKVQQTVTPIDGPGATMRGGGPKSAKGASRGTTGLTRALGR